MSSQNVGKNCSAITNKVCLSCQGQVFNNSFLTLSVCPCLLVWMRSSALIKSSFLTTASFLSNISLHDVATWFHIPSFPCVYVCVCMRQHLCAYVCVLSRRTPTRGVKTEISAHWLTLSEPHSAHGDSMRCLQVRVGC